IIVNVLEKLEDEKNHQKKKTELESQCIEYIQRTRDTFLVDFLSNKAKLQVFHTFQPLIKLKAIGRMVAVIVSFCLDLGVSNNTEDFQDVFLEVLKPLNHTHEGTMVTALCGELPEEVVLCMDATLGRKKVETTLLQIMQEFRERTGIECIAGIGEAVDDLALAPRSYAQAREAIGFRFLASFGELIFYSSIADADWRNGCLYGQLLEKCDLLSGKIVHQVQKSNMVNCASHVDEFLGMLTENRSESKNLLNRFMMEIAYHRTGIWQPCRG
ncbi:MAG TPA: hypothetical protein VFD00_12315, partial [Thermoclostridium sp.]|nr:hypothetical protein [Thermoclostridium sp.]